MSKYLITNFTAAFPLEINASVLKTALMLMYSFEARQKHPDALNTPLLGVYPMYFTTQDQNNLFDMFDVDPADFKKAIKKCPSINQAFNVISDPYNLFVTWVLHCIYVSNELTHPEKNQLSMVISKMLHYKFFTSLVNHNFKYAANKDIMEATINGLNKKYDIIEYGTWKNLIEARCQDLLGEQSIHYKTLLKYDNDEAITYILSDTQTRLRNKIRLIVTAYYDTKARGDAIGTHSLNTEIDGEKLMVDTVSTYDSMLTNISGQVLNINQWIDASYIKFVTKWVPNISENLLKQLLVAYSAKASQQARTRQLDLTKEDGDTTLYIGSRVLIKTIIQKTYRSCILSKINMKNKVEILAKTRNVYSASRISDPAINDVKESVAMMIDECLDIQRDATKSSLRIAFICYIMLKSFEYL